MYSISERVIHGRYVSTVKKNLDIRLIAEVYLSHIEIDALVAAMDHGELLQLIDPQKVVSQLLLAHLVALHLILRPIVCRERKNYTVTMFSIRMTRWMERIQNNVSKDYEKFLSWPVYISELHIAGNLEKHSLA